MTSLAGRLVIVGVLALVLTATISCGAVEKAEKSDVAATKPEMAATVTDDGGKEHKFLSAQSNSSRIGWNTSRLVAVIEKAGVFYLADLSKIDRIERLTSQEVTIHMRSGQRLSGNWVCADRTTNFYNDQNNEPEVGYIYGTCDGAPSKIQIDRVKKIVFDEVKVTPDEVGKEKYSKKVELKNGSSFVTDCGFVIDFCGHSWRSTQHLRLTDTCEVMKGGSIPLADVAEILFTGAFGADCPQCREIVLKFKNGKEEKALLLLTSESYNGECNHSARFRGFDKIYLRQDCGGVLIDLDNVAKVIPNPAPEKAAVAAEKGGPARAESAPAVP